LNVILKLTFNEGDSVIVSFVLALGQVQGATPQLELYCVACNAVEKSVESTKIVNMFNQLVMIFIVKLQNFDFIIVIDYDNLAFSKVETL